MAKGKETHSFFSLNSSFLLQSTKGVRGRDVSVFIQQVYNVDGETLDNFTPIPLDTVEDQKVFEALEKDGLKLGEWITVPDPFEEEWPYERRYPGVPFPPDIQELPPW